MPRKTGILKYKLDKLAKTFILLNDSPSARLRLLDVSIYPASKGRRGRLVDNC